MHRAPSLSIRAALTLAVLGLAACPGDDAPPNTSTLSTSGASTSSSTSAEATDGDSTTTGSTICDPLPPSTTECCCFETLDDGYSVVVVNACPSPLVCDPLEIECPPDAPGCPLNEGGEEGEFWVDDEAVLECILSALRDGTEGRLSWTFTGADFPGFERRHTSVHVLPDREAITDTLLVLDLGGPWSDVTREGLDPAPDFEACLAAVDLVDRIACLVSPTDGQVAEVCTEGGYYEEI